MMWHFGDGMGWPWVFGGIWMVVFWGGLVALIVWGVKKLTERDGSSSRKDPLDIAKERYARGDISADGYERLKKDLHS